MEDNSEFEQIHAAAKAGDAEEVSRLLKADTGLVRGVSRLLSADSKLTGARDKYQNVPLHHAANAAVARLLIEHGAYVNATGWMGATPLYEAAKNGRADVVKLLIEHGADVSAKRERDDTPLHFASTAEIARLLVENGASVHARDDSGRTPLHWVAQYGHVEVARYLLNCGAEVDAISEVPTGAENIERRSYFNETPLHIAAQEGKLEVVEFLLAAGAKVNARDHYDRTPLHKAAFRGHDEVVKRLIEAGADPHLRNKDGRKPLHEAQRQATKDLLLALMGRGGSSDVSINGPLGEKIKQILLHPTRQEALAVAHNAVLSRWRLEGSRPRMIVAVQTPHARCKAAILPDPEFFLCSSPTGVEIRRWDDLCVVGDLELQEKWDRPGAPAVSPNGRWIAVATGGEKLLLIERETGRITSKAPADEGTLSTCFSPDSRLLATACSFQGGGHVRIDAIGDDGVLTQRLMLWRSDYKTRAEQFVDTLARVTFDPSGQRLALFETSAICHDAKPRGWRGNVVLFDLQSGRELWCASIDASTTCDPRSKGESYPMGFLTDVVFVNGGRCIACGATAGALLFYNVADGSFLHRSMLHDTTGITALASDITCNLLWVGLENGQVVCMKPSI